MSFNLKVINYPNGSCQIRYYSKALVTKDDMSVSEVSEISDKVSAKERYENQFVLNPFTDSWDMVDYSGSDGEVDSDHKDSGRLKRSLNRSKQKIYEHARSLKWEWFVTFTFNPEKVDSYNYDECSRVLREWLKYYKKNYAPDLKYLVIPELHQSGRWHFHGVLFNLGNIALTYHGLSYGKHVYNMPVYDYGFSTVTKVSDVFRVSHYICKYITKDLLSALPGKQCYYVSKGLPKPDTFVLSFVRKEENLLEYVENYAASLGKTLQHVTSIGDDISYTKTTYFELG